MGLKQVEELDERVVHIARTSKVVKGGRHFSFRAVVVVGDNKGSVGVGVGKAAKCLTRSARVRSGRAGTCVPIAVAGTTIPHEVTSRFSAAQVLHEAGIARYGRDCGRWCTCRG